MEQVYTRFPCIKQRNFVSYERIVFNGVPLNLTMRWVGGWNNLLAEDCTTGNLHLFAAFLTMINILKDFVDLHLNLLV
jgi:hypothetical protein